jgi:hypothetical protein
LLLCEGRIVADGPVETVLGSDLYCQPAVLDARRNRNEPRSRNR